MARLTNNNIDYCETYCENNRYRCPIYSSCINRKAYEKLKDYEEAEDRRLLLRLPCKVGDSVYVIAPKFNDCKEECSKYDSEEYLRTWCVEHCPNGFKGIGILNTTIERIEITENDVRILTRKTGYRNLNDIFVTQLEAAADRLRSEQGDRAVGRISAGDGTFWLRRDTDGYDRCCKGRWSRNRLNIYFESSSNNKISLGVQSRILHSFSSVSNLIEVDLPLYILSTVG